MRLSIVTTMYCSASFLREFYDRACAAAERITTDYELIFVNDGSPDNSRDIARSLHESDPRVRVIDLSRNFGHAKAIMTGLAHARGELVFLIDCDLEEDPALLSEFQDELNSTGADVIFGVQKKRKGRLFERISGYLFWWLINWLSGALVTRNQITVRLMRRAYVAALVGHKDRALYLPGIMTVAGFRQLPLVVAKKANQVSTYTLRKKVAQAVDAVTSFSVLPLVAIFYLGGGIVAVSSLAAAYLIIKKLFFQSYDSGWPSLIVSIWLLGGLTIFCIGLLGIYLSKVFVEVKQRPYTVIANLYERSKDTLDSARSMDRLMHASGEVSGEDRELLIADRLQHGWTSSDHGEATQTTTEPVSQVTNGRPHSDRR